MKKNDWLNSNIERFRLGGLVILVRVAMLLTFLVGNLMLLTIITDLRGGSYLGFWNPEPNLFVLLIALYNCFLFASAFVKIIFGLREVKRGKSTEYEINEV
ncbi:MAG: hypothetical protein WD512_12790 [Candidatus Paceibacterota bacterium]